VKAALNIHRQNGIALVLVLWITLLVTITSGAYALMARMDQLEANALLSGTRARLIAEAGVHLTAVQLRDPDELLRPVADGRLYQQTIDGVQLEIRITDERGKLDINAADEQTLTTLFFNHGLEIGNAELLAAAVMDWRDEDEVERVNGAEMNAYLAAGLAVGPANRPFMMIDELLQVLGMSYSLYQNIEPGISVYSRSALPDPAFAPPEALLAIPEITQEEAENLVVERNTLEPGDDIGVALPDGQVIMAQGRGLTYSIHAKATMPNGVWEQLEATIRLGGSRSGAPFRVLRWREGFHH
jgi:general secretion pathway protein K